MSRLQNELSEKDMQNAIREHIKKKRKRESAFLQFISHFHSSMKPPSRIEYKQFSSEDYDARKKHHKILRKFVPLSPYTLNYNMYLRREPFVSNKFLVYKYIILIRILRNDPLRYRYILKRYQITRYQNP